MPQQYTVAEICRVIETKIKSSPELQDVWIKGEITSYQKHASSGHIYMTLSDSSQKNQNPRPTIRCTYFRFAQTPLDFELKMGLEVEILGTTGIYAPQSTYSFTVKRVQKIGAGDLLQKLQQIRERLLKEGLIKTPETRRELPPLPRRVGIVTGAGTAAYRDILKQVQERYPHAEIVLAPAQVQGEAAPQSIVAALSEIQKKEWRCDVVIVGRGGGSAEDLMAFNDEAVCRAIATCRIAVVSAVGHQIDHPISDDVADYAAATPTDAARAVFPVIEDLQYKAENHLKRAFAAVEAKLQLFQERFLRTSTKEFWEKPYVLVKDQAHFLDELESKLNFTFRNIVNSHANALNRLTPLEVLAAQKIKLTRAEFESTAGRFEAYSPLATLKRGYSVVYSGDKIVTDATTLKSGTDIRVRLAKGEIEASVK
ncbi:exodeoxyribonuclease VII large subunit [Turneriella parva]|uniref:Exodeoxyribonuclease 7 large subunit n=1 Tax=Turneriella parva (strain ATCC BAA-1111 / DSM 21527 / NCTC 11395 / H) TaxID=869212 RepID=I4B6D7_TURPD|nr:exodeoxyribonuclease VII large subunit [Turneriella parva]AFM12844.1 Exodeoxyribonuclease VII large subunit [Turneriella parva DSM 21527]